MWMIAANFRWTHSPSRLAWSEGWRPPGAQSTFIRWTGRTLAMTLGHNDSTINIVMAIIIIIMPNYTCRNCLRRFAAEAPKRKRLKLGVVLCRSIGVRGGCGVHPGAVWGKEPQRDERGLLPPDVCDRHQQHSVCVRRRHRRHHRQQPPRLRTLLTRAVSPRPEFVSVDTHVIFLCGVFFNMRTTWAAHTRRKYGTELLANYAISFIEAETKPRSLIPNPGDRNEDQYFAFKTILEPHFCLCSYRRRVSLEQRFVTV